MMQKQVDKPKTRPYNNVIDGTQSRRIHRRLRRGVCEWCFSFFLLFIKKAADSLGRFFVIYIWVRPSIALASVTSSVYSRSPPTGRPCAMRVTKIPIGLSRRAI